MYALVKDGVVQKIVPITSNLTEQYDAVIQCSNYVQVGDLFSNGTGFSKPDSSHYASTTENSIVVETESTDEANSINEEVPDLVDTSVLEESIDASEGVVTGEADNTPETPLEGSTPSVDPELVEQLSKEIPVEETSVSEK